MSRWPGGVPPPIAGAGPAATHVLDSADATNATSYSVASTTYTAGKVYLLTVGHRAATAGTPTVSGGSTTWTSVVAATSPAGAGKVTVFRYAPASNQTTGLTISFGAATQNNCCWSLDEWVTDNGGSNGANAIVQTTTANGTGGPNMAGTLSAFGSTANGTFVAANTAGGANSFTVEGGSWALLSDRRAPSESNRLGSAWLASNDTTPSINETAPSDWSLVAVEVKAEAHSGASAISQASTLTETGKKAASNVVVMPGASKFVSDGAPGNARVATPSNAAFSFTGDFSLRVAAAADDWFTDAGSGGPLLIGKGSNFANYGLVFLDERRLVLFFTDSPNLFSASAAAFPAVDGGTVLLRADFDQDTGSGQFAITYFYKPDVGGDWRARCVSDSDWTQLGAPITGASFTPTTNVGPLCVGAPSSAMVGVLEFDGFVRAAVVKNAAGTVVADPDFAIQVGGSTSFVDSSGRTWTTASGGVITADANEVATVLATGTKAASGAATITTVTATTATGRKAASGVGAISAATATSASGQKGGKGTGAISAISATTATGRKDTSGASTISQASTLVAPATTQRAGTAAIATVSSVTEAGHHAEAGEAFIGSSAVLTETGRKAASSSSAITATTATSASGQRGAARAAAITHTTATAATKRKNGESAAAISRATSTSSTGRKRALGDAEIVVLVAEVSATGSKGADVQIIQPTATSAAGRKGARGTAAMSALITLFEMGFKTPPRPLGPTAVIVGASITKAEASGPSATRVARVGEPTRVEVLG